MSAYTVTYPAVLGPISRTFAVREQAEDWLRRIGHAHDGFITPERLVRDQSAGARAVRVPCLTCHKMVTMSECVVDTEGPAFQAYYHSDCIPGGVQAPILWEPGA